MKKVFLCMLLFFVILAGGISNSGFAQAGNTEVGWSEEKEGVYRPLLSQTLLWSDEVMKFGGFDFDTGTVVTDRTKADVVMNIYSDMGARKVALMDSFAEPLNKNSIVFPTDGFGYPLTSMKIKEKDIFLIEANDGKFIQMRIDRITPSTEVHFTYVVEQDAPAQEDFKDYKSIGQKSTSDKLKVWTIRFNQPVDAKTVNNNTIYVKDSKGYLLETRLSVSSDNKEVYISPVNSYKNGEKYTIYATNYIKNKSGKNMVKGTIMSFLLDLSNQSPDTDEDNNPDPQYSQYYGDWELELAYVPFGDLQVSKDGSYKWTGGPNGSSSGKWEVRDYGFVLVNADGGDDYVIEPSNKNKSGIKLLTVTDGKYNDGSPILIYFCDGK